MLLRIGSRPLGQFWAWLTGTINGLPQAELWTVLVGLFGLVGLRSLALRADRPAADRRTQFRSQGSLRGWLELLDDHTRGEYFRWRLARRIATLVDELGLPAPADDPRIKAFLAAGRQERTIRPHRTRSELSLDPAILVEYLAGSEDLNGAA